MTEAKHCRPGRCAAPQAITGSSNALIRLAITQSELFSSWPMDTVSLLIEAADILVLEAGTFLTEAGKSTDCLYLLASGSIRLTRPLPGGLEMGGQLLLPGDFYGMAPLITQRPFQFTATCREACFVVRVPRKPLLDLLSKDG